MPVWLGTLLLLTMVSRSAAQTRGGGWQDDRMRIAQAIKFNEELGDRIWPGLRRTPMPVLLVTDSAEYLVERAASGGARVVSVRPRRFSPTLLATFPVDGVPTIVTGTAERTGKSPTQWVLTLIHEHFHQWQYAQPEYYSRVARLDLARGDTTGMWMLNYPFPYDSAPVVQAVRRLARTLAGALSMPRAGTRELRAVVNARDALRSQLSAADYRYFEFQLWQEGVARFVEYRAAELASGQKRFRAAAAHARRNLLRELEQLDLRHHRRVSFYPIGAAIALLLDQIEPRWKQAYGERPFSLSTLLAAGNSVR